MDERKTKILFITARADFGGGQEHLYKLSKSLSGKFEIYFACPEDYPYYEKFLNIAGEDHLVKIPHREFSYSDLISVADFVRKNRIDFIHSHGKGAGIYSRLLTIISGKKTIHTFHGLHVGSYNKFQKLVYLLLEKTLAVFTSKIIAVSYGERDEILESRICSSKKIKVIENGVEIPSEKIEPHLGGNEKLVISTITRFDFAKNSGMLVDIAEKLKLKIGLREFVIEVLGDGEQRKLVEEKVNEKSLSENFRFYGAVTNPQEYLLNSHCYLSTSRWEGLPLALLEAMAVGLPVVATDVVGNRDVVKDSINGFLFDLSNPVEAVEDLLKLTRDNELFAMLSQNARELIIKNFSVGSMVKKTENLYYSVINKRKNEAGD